jgi:hypothetical protein
VEEEPKKRQFDKKFDLAPAKIKPREEIKKEMSKK